VAKLTRGASLIVWALIVSALLTPHLGAQVTDPEPDSLQARIVASVLADGYWDESGGLSSAEMAEVVAEYGDSFAFAFTDRAYSVENQPDRSGAALLALSTLEQLQLAGGPSTLLFVTEDDATGATNEFIFSNVVQTLQSFDRSSPAASFAEAASRIESLGTTFVEVEPEPQVAQTGFLGGLGILIVLGVIAAGLGLLSARTARKKRNNRVHTANARTSTRGELQAMSDLILDLDPRVTIADDADLKARFVDASDTYRAVLEEAESASTGHEVADLRIDIAKARWKLDVIDAELDGRTPPAEPFTRDNSGSAWDSTRGSGGDSGPSGAT